MVQFKLNMPSALRERLGEAAEKSGRSLTAEVLARLEKSFENDEEWQLALGRISDIEEKLEYVFAHVFPGKVWAGSRPPESPPRKGLAGLMAQSYLSNLPGHDTVLGAFPSPAKKPR
ncbi:Arc family DNA-binding protein [Paenirhodobacter populi]|nr:Arc family DNA-binding protein [Sinirhodobacter populi]